eukprot:SAG11_NODE_34863_length_269_cov_1.723529_1_plen_29_part_10
MKKDADPQWILSKKPVADTWTGGLPKMSK